VSGGGILAGACDGVKQPLRKIPDKRTVRTVDAESAENGRAVA
jgi:hypothetical protein